MKGSCLCGSVQFSFGEFSGGIANCHCKMCQKFSGSAYGVFGCVRADQLKWLSGKDLIKEYQSSSKALRGFCGHCGSSIYYRLQGQNQDYEIAFGLLDEEPLQKIEANIFCESKAQWAEEMDTLPSYEKGRT